jgi:predicted glutamine amidotransferase
MGPAYALERAAPGKIFNFCGADCSLGETPVCRWIAYRGETVPLEQYVTQPARSLLAQSLDAFESLASVNGDGFGLGWYGLHEDPGIYREVRPAWSDDNMRHLCRHIRSHLFFAHVRASTGTPSTRPNCHPFSHERWMFMHNGQIGDWSKIRRRVEGMIPDAFYASRIGTTDSEAAFLAILGAGGNEGPIAATERTLVKLNRIVAESETKEPVRFTAALSDGKNLYAFRYASDDTANTLYYREYGGNLVVVSEPLDLERAHWVTVPPGHMVVARDGEHVRLAPFLTDVQAAAAE